MAKKEDLEELGHKFIDLEIEILNKTNTSIFENGVYNKEFLEIPEWENGIKEFLMFDRGIGTKSELGTKYFYQSLAELVNKAYIRYKETLGNLDRLNLKAYLQITEILEQEEKIYALERYETSKEVIEAQEVLNRVVINSYTNRLKSFQMLVSSNKRKASLKRVVENKDKKEIQEAFSKEELGFFTEMYDLIKDGNEKRLQKEIEDAKRSIEEAKKRQEEYEKKKEQKEKLTELKRDKNTAENFFANTEAVKSMIQVLRQCCNYFYTLIFLNEFMKSLCALDLQNEFYFMKPLELMSFSKLEGGLWDLDAVLEHKGIKGKDFNKLKEFDKIAERYVKLAFLDVNKAPETNDRSILKEYSNIRRTILDLRTSLNDYLKIPNRKDYVRNIFELEDKFIKTLFDEGGTIWIKANNLQPLKQP